MTTRPLLGDADEMYHRYFDRWYDEVARKLKGFGATRPDLLRIPDYVGRSVDELCPIPPDAAAEVLTQVETMQKAAAVDWAQYLSVDEPIDLDWIEKFDAHYDQARIEELLRESDPADFSNTYIVTVCEFGAALGLVMKGLLPRLAWLPSWPYWETSIFDPDRGAVIPVFHWAIKKFSTYGIDDGFAEKVQVCIQILEDGPISSTR